MTAFPRKEIEEMLRRYDFELAAPPESDANDHSKMVESVRQPCRVRFRRRSA
jgi:sterol 14-demethylase